MSRRAGRVRKEGQSHFSSACCGILMIETRPSRSYVARAIFIVVLCLGFSIWGAYDLWVAIPRRAQMAQRYGDLKKQMEELDASRQARAASGQPTQAEIAEYT